MKIHTIVRRSRIALPSSRILSPAIRGRRRRNSVGTASIVEIRIIKLCFSGNRETAGLAQQIQNFFIRILKSELRCRTDNRLDRSQQQKNHQRHYENYFDQSETGGTGETSGTSAGAGTFLR